MITLHTDKGLIQVNPEAIRAILPHSDGAKIFFSEHHVLVVNDTPHQIKALVSEWERGHV